MIKILSIATMSSFIYEGTEYILVTVSDDGSFNLITPLTERYQLPQHFYCADFPSPEEITRVCDKYLKGQK